MYEKIYSELLNNLDNGIRSILVTEVEIENSRNKIVNKELFSLEDLKKEKFDKKFEPLVEELKNSFNLGTPQKIQNSDKMFIIEPFFPKPRVVIFGGGHIAKPLVDLCVDSEFSVTVIDDRPVFANTGRFPRADEVICDSFKSSFNRVNLRKDDFVVIVTRGHKHDNICLRNALEVDGLAFLGMIGSKKRVRDMMNELKDDGYSDQLLSKVKSPIGLDIGAVTPFEIAISIIAELIEYRRRKSNMAKGLPRKFNWPEFDRDVISSLSKKEDMDRAIITITMSKGSVPRKAGAKMLVYPDGRILGSIGGGCAEAGIINTARDLIREKGCIEERVDMTNEEAEKSGMACGGIIDVLIEAF
ncbi:MAG: XdhC family protein [Andreesenia angusta]|nr:XdhC family protein [Andreesenia angusta]